VGEVFAGGHAQRFGLLIDRRHACVPRCSIR
jgi:hypothetical protein